MRGLIMSHWLHLILVSCTSLGFSDIKSQESTVTRSHSYSLPSLPPIDNNYQLNRYLIQVFIDNNESKISDLLSFIHKNYKSTISDVHATIVTWALENKHHAVEKYVKSISQRVLRKKHETDHSLKLYLLTQAIHHHNDNLVEYLVPLFSSRVISEKKYQNFTVIEHAQKINNQKALTLLKPLEKTPAKYRRLKRFIKGCVGSFLILEAFVQPYFWPFWLI